MSGKITGFLREFKLIFSIKLTILGLFIFILGITGVWLEGNLWNLLGISGFLDWSPYFLFIGFFVLAMGIYYLYVYLKDRKFVLEELEENKRSVFIKKHSQVKSKVKHLPSKYRKMLKEKEEELKIR